MSSANSIRGGYKMKNLLDRVSWKALFIVLGVLIAIRLLLEFD